MLVQSGASVERRLRGGRGVSPPPRAANATSSSMGRPRGGTGARTAVSSTSVVCNGARARRMNPRASFCPWGRTRRRPHRTSASARCEIDGSATSSVDGWALGAQNGYRRAVQVAPPFAGRPRVWPAEQPAGPEAPTSKRRKSELGRRR
jgi:hypothetical protein